MKRINWLYGAVVLGMLSACTSDDVPKKSDDKGGVTFYGDGYLAVQIALPSERVTRANDNFKDGDPKEYEVKEAALVLFSSDADKTENDADFIGAYSISNFDIDKTDNNVTSTAVVGLPNLKLDNKKLYGLVLINYKGVVNLKCYEDTNPSSSLTVTGKNITKFSELLSETTANDLYEVNSEVAEHFFMTNAVLSKQPGGATVVNNPTIFTLAELDGTALKDTEQDAKNSPAGCIFVERAVAKVTTELSNNKITIGGVEFKVSVAHALSNIEPNSYYVRNTDGVTGFAWNLYSTIKSTADYRMIGFTQMPDKEFYRTYWCKDPNGDGFDLSAENATTTLIKKTLEETDFLDGSKPLYCHENTFSVANQNNGNTTRIVYKVTMTPSVDNSQPVDLYVFDDRTKIYTLEAARTYVKAGVLSYDALKNALASLIKSDAQLPEDSNLEKYITIGYDETDKLKVNTISLNTNADGFSDIFDNKTDDDFKNAITETSLNNIISSVNSTYGHTEYKGGVSYYDVYIHHFGDDQTPLASDWSGSTIDLVYPGKNAANYLGRYGLVRNNWYEIEISKFTGIGEPTIPEINVNIPDDYKPDKKYMAAHVHMLSWAKRTQKHEF